MNGSILYIVTTNVTERPIISGTTESELKSLYEALTALSTEQNGGMEILDTQRCVISASGKVIYTRVWLCFDKYGLEIHDTYRNLLDSYRAPERNPERYKYRYVETWEQPGELTAESMVDAEAQLEKMDERRELHTLGGNLIDKYYEIWKD